MTENLAIWDKFSDIDPKFTKAITGKDYKGTSPNAHYIVKCLTELFGPVGVGFGWRVLAESVDHFGDTAIHWCRIEFWHTNRANVFESYGQTKMAYKTRGADGYLKVDEDAPKKSLTDAITKAAAQVGIAANIFLGRWDDNKYVEALKAEFKEASQPKFNAEEFVVRLFRSIDAARTLPELKNFFAEAHSQRASLTDKQNADLVAAKNERKNYLIAQDKASQAPADDTTYG